MFVFGRREWSAQEVFLSAVMGDFLGCLLKGASQPPAHCHYSWRRHQRKEIRFPTSQASLGWNLLSDGPSTALNPLHPSSLARPREQSWPFLISHRQRANHFQIFWVGGEFNRPPIVHKWESRNIKKMRVCFSPLCSQYPCYIVDWQAPMPWGEAEIHLHRWCLGVCLFF